MNSITRPICVGKTVSGNSISIMWRISEINLFDSVADDLYLSIDADLADGHLSGRMRLPGVYSISNQGIPINDVYTALIGNSVINTVFKSASTRKKCVRCFKSAEDSSKIKQRRPVHRKHLNTMSD